MKYHLGAIFTLYFSLLFFHEPYFLITCPFSAIVLMDISSYLMLCESYADAKSALKDCQTAYNQWKLEPEAEDCFCKVTSDVISAYAIAVGINPPNFTPTLRQEFHNLVQDQYVVR
ncbi:unnamed protein product [Nesidiocoris tenuis]|uniref:Uncharacterized protein n=1 Tax=Nesidiocoris tenuis TaxID=355587 RepID=A0A6H5FTI9_9HEMI|nr:unnamed protein product [Nesidiocoris tenuis]